MLKQNITGKLTFSIFVNNALTQIHFISTNCINAQLTQHAFSVWPMAKPVVGEMEMHSVTNLMTLQTPLATPPPP